MMEKKVFFYKSKVLLVVLANIASLIGFMVLDCRASSSKSENPTFSLTVENKPLELVLQNISKSTGYKITVNKEWSDLPISASLKDVSLEKGLRRLLQGFNHALLTVGGEKEITIIIYGPPSEKRTINASSEVIPPVRPGKKGVTLGEVEAKRMGQRKLAPKDQEIIPPTIPGNAGVTLQEMEKLRQEMEKLQERKDISTAGDRIPVPPDSMLQKVKHQP